MVTNELQSYTVFTYQCGELNWVHRNRASIGFSASFTSFTNHPLSRLQNVNDTACLSQQCPPWTNVFYKISRELGDTLHPHKCLESIIILPAKHNFLLILLQKWFDIIYRTCTFHPCKYTISYSRTLMYSRECLQLHWFGYTYNQPTCCLPGLSVQW